MRVLKFFLGFVGLLWLSTFLIAVCLATGVFARDAGQWENGDQAIREWYRNLKRPDSEGSCCGEADAYWADKINVRDGKTYATITDDRPDEPLGRPHIPAGTVIEIPPEKLKWDSANPTGHVIVFLSRERFVFCFVQGSGI